MRYQQTNERRAVILMVVLSLLTLFALVGVTFVLYADAEAAAARVARQASTMQTADVKPQEALAFFLSQLIYDAPDTGYGIGSGLRGHSLARTMYGLNYTVPPLPGLNNTPFDGIGRLHYASSSGLGYPTTPLTNVPNNFGGVMDDYALVNYTWFSADGFIRDPERYGVRTNAQVVANTQPNFYVPANAPYTYPDLNNFFLAAMRADGTVLTPSYHRPWLFQVVNGKYYAFNDMTNPNWSNQVGKYMTLRPRPFEHPSFPLPADATGDVKNLPWAPGGNDSIWVDLGAPVMTAPDGTLYKMMFAPLIVDLDGRVNLNTAGNILAYIAAMGASSGAPNGPAAWQAASASHVSNQGWGPWEVNLSKVLYGDQATYVQSTPPQPPEWMRLFTGASLATTTAPNPPTMPIITQPGELAPTPLPPGLSGWLLPGVRGRYLETLVGGSPLFTPNAPPASVIPFYPSAIGLNTTYLHSYAQGDLNAYNETNGALPTARPVLPTAATPTATSAFPSFALSGYSNGNLPTEGTNHPLLSNAFQNPFNTFVATRAFRASDMESLLRPNIAGSGPTNVNASAVYSDLTRLCPANLGPMATSGLALRYRNLVTSQSWDVGAPGVTPYWWNGMTTGFLASNATNYLLAPFAAQPAQTAGAVTSSGLPPLPPNATAGNIPGTTIPYTSEFGPDWSALSANPYWYFPYTFNPLAPQYNPAGVTSPGYVSPGARIRLNRPLPPYPHMGALLTPPYNSLPPTTTPSPYGYAYNLTVPSINNQYLAAQNARQALTNDIYRRLLAIAGLPVIPISPAGVNPPPSGTSANPNSTQLAPRRWLAQLAVNIVDYMDEDDIMTPFNFYTVQDNYNLPLATPVNPNAGNPTTTWGPDDNDPTLGNTKTTATGANPDYWVFGTELPKVVLNEALAEAQQPDPTKAAASGESVKMWIELFNTMPVVGGTNTQPQDNYRVPLYMNIPGGGGYSPYRVSISQYTMDRASTTPPAGGTTAQLPDNSANVLGKAYVTSTFPQSTTDVDFSALVQLSQNLTNPAPNPPAMEPPSAPIPGQFVPGSAPPVPVTINAGVDPQNFFLIGPSTNLTKYQDPFASPGLPINIPVLRTDNVTYTPNWTGASTTDERTYGLTVMLRRLANPYLPLQTNPTLPNYNPYVTVDYIQSVPLQSTNSTSLMSSGKTQPYAGLNLQAPTGAGGAITPPPANSPVLFQVTNATPPPAGAVTTNKVVNTFGYGNYPLPPSGHYDWLVHLDRPPISPMELLHVSAWPPYKLTQQFMQGANNLPTTGTTINTFAHYAPWFDTLPLGVSLSTPTTNINCPWWFDPTLPAGSSHRLYRLFEFLECGDRAFGVNGLGRIPGKININTVWDAEILQALIDANLSMGINANPPATPLNLPADVVSQIFTNMMISRSPAYYNMGTYANVGTLPYPSAIGPVNMGTALDDRPFMPLSTGQFLATPASAALTPSEVQLQYPNGLSIGTDTILRTNNPFSNKAASGNMLAYPPPQAPTTPLNQWLLFQNYTDTQLTHPYYQTQLLTKLYNNITTRSNTYAVFLTVGFFQVIPGPAGGNANIPQLGPEIGRSEGKQVRHRMFAIVDRTNLATFTTTGQAVSPATAVTGPNATTNPPNLTGYQQVQIPAPVTPATPNTTVSGNPANAAQLLVANPLTGIPGVIQAGTQLVIDPGNVNEETVTVISVTPPASVGAPAYFTANFTLAHGAGNTPFAIIQRGNPGPWLLTPYDPRLDGNVVLYFSLID